MKQKQKLKTTAQPVAKKEKVITDFSGKFLNKYRALITFGLFSVLLFIIFHDFIFGNLFYLFKDIGSDSLNIAYPNFVTVTKYIHTEGFPLWSFAEGMGQNTMPFSVGDPFCWIVYLAGSANTAYSIIWMESIKMVLTAIIIYHFFKFWNLSPVSLLIGTLLYCFSGFIIVGGGWGMFSSEAFFLALLLLSFEKLYSQNSWYLFPLAIALLAIFQPFDIYLLGLFLIIYILFRHFSSDDHSWKKLLNVTFKMIILSLIGFVISTFFLLSSIQHELESPRIGGNSSYISKLMSQPMFFMESKWNYTTAILRFFANDLVGNGNNFKGWSNYLEAPLFYVGLLPLLLVPQVFAIVNKRKKIVFSLFILFFILPVIFPYFRYAIWVFVGDYYRGFSFFVGLAFLFLSLLAFNEIDKAKKINPVVLFSTLVFLLILLYYPYQYSEQIVNQDLQSVVRNFLVLYALLLFLFRFEKYKPLLRILVVLTVFIEIAYLNGKTVSERVVLSKDEMNSRVGYNDYSIDAVKFINSHENGFYRVNKDYSSGPAVHQSLNDAKVQGFYGTMCYNNFNQKYYISFLEEMSIIKKGEESQTRWAPGLASRPLLLNMASNKYHLSKQSKPFFLQIGYDSVARFNDVRVLRNRHFLPLGFTYSSYIQLSSFLKLSTLKKDIALQKAFVATEPIDNDFLKLKPFDLKDTLLNYTNNDYYNDVNLLKQDTLNITHFSQNRITGTIYLKNPKLLFFSIPYDKGWNAVIDNKKVKPMMCNIGFMGFFLQPGQHSIVLFYKPPFYYQSMIITILAFLIYMAYILFDKFYLSKRKTNN